ncbi:MAG: alanine:cation symporter family protein [Deltaproteobacteria bacterium]|nr:alanine:cation symporter family protein [Deltaproteobacteria bacterium]
MTIQATFNHFFETINGRVASVLFWSDHPLKLPIILLVMVFGGLFFTISYGFVNVRLFKHAWNVVRGKYDKEGHEGEITHFQALTSALSATVGLGNIAGVALAISLGGPGAVFWLWVVAFFGMSMKFSSSTLAQLYRRVSPDGSVLGGPMVYLEDGFKKQKPKLKKVGKGFAVTFAFFTIAASLGGGNMFQGNQAFELLVSQFPALKGWEWVAGVILALAVGAVLLGGIKRVGEVTSKLVPAMCGFYCLTCLFIIMTHYSMVPGLFQSIFVQAFNPDAIWAGGFIGVLTQGIRRASFSNEAGLGSASIAHAAAKTDRPVREGVVAMLGPFIDTHLVCTMTSLSILITGAHLDPKLAGKGAAITAAAFSSLGSAMPMALTIAALIFAYSTMISWGFYGEKGVEYLFGKSYVSLYRVFYVCVAVLGPVLSLKHIIDFSDLMLLSMAFPNIIGMMFLASKTRTLLAEYYAEYMEGKMELVPEEGEVAADLEPRPQEI